MHRILRKHPTRLNIPKTGSASATAGRLGSMKSPRLQSADTLARWHVHSYACDGTAARSYFGIRIPRHAVVAIERGGVGEVKQTTGNRCSRAIAKKTSRNSAS